ncbi:MAG: hypothetical protein K1X75_11910, partial [Leptospirales bacterium]|nr:hypothetical protein [Leptospirales bacterium]
IDDRTTCVRQGPEQNDAQPLCELRQYTHNGWSRYAKFFDQANAIGAVRKLAGLFGSVFCLSLSAGHASFRFKVDCV